MTRQKFKIQAIVSLIAILVLGIAQLEPDFFKSLKIDFIEGFSLGILVGSILVFTMLAFGEIEILDKEE